MQRFSSRSLAAVALFGTFGATILSAQSTHPTPPAAPGLEFPVLMRQKVEAGKTPVGTKIEAKLTVATLVNGVVIPQDAIFSGEVIESASKTAGDPSRLAICIESAEWKNGSTPAVLVLPSKIYLTAWYYPLVQTRDFPEGLADATHSGPRRRGGAPPFPDPNTRDSQPYPRGNGTEEGTGPASTTPSASVTPHREIIKNVESTKTGGVVALVSAHSTIKLDKSTTYVFAADDLGANSRAP
jgi:hypothetical protein